MKKQNKEREQNKPERRPSLLGGDGNPIDFVSQQPEALTHAIYDDNGVLPSPRAEYSSGGRNAIQNAQYYDSLGDYNRFFTQDALNNEMSGPDANAVYYANGMTVPERNLINQIANLAYNKVENERIDQQDYQKALIAQVLQPESTQGLSLLEQTGNRPLSRQRYINGVGEVMADTRNRNNERENQRRNDRTVEPGSIDPNRDTVYRVGGSDPYEAGNYYSQSQLNNTMSGNDANAIYYATHDQRGRRTYNDPDVALKAEALDIMGSPINGILPFAPDNMTGGEALQEAYRARGLKPYTGQQMYPFSDAYVAGADAPGYPLSPVGRSDVLPQGLGSYEGIPDELMAPGTKKKLYQMYLQQFLEDNPYLGR